MSLKTLRQDAGYTQQEVADLIPGVTQGAVSQWEKGLTSPHISKIEELARLYNVAVDVLLAASTTTRNQSKQNKAPA